MSTSTTASQLDLVREALASLLANGSSPSNPMCQGLAMQIAMHERNEWRKANGGWWGDNSRFLQMPCATGRREGSK
jgi:hypothetical protein